MVKVEDDNGDEEIRHLSWDLLGERVCETSFGALGAPLGFSWSLFDSSWGLFGGAWKGLGSSSGALGDVLCPGDPLLS